jgi:hypothetical protein
LFDFYNITCLTYDEIITPYTEGKLAIFEFDNAPYQKVAGGHPIGGKQVVNPSYLIDNMKNPYERREKMFNMLNVVMYEGDKNMPGSMM